MKPLLQVIALTICWQVLQAQEQTVGVFINNEDAQEGYTLFSPIPSKSTYLIDNCGRLVNQWERMYNASFSGFLNKEGHLIRAGKSVNPNDSDNLSGGILEIISWDNETIWSFEFNTPTRLQHHDLTQMPNGNLLIIAWERNTPEEQLALGRDPNMITNPYLWTEAIFEIRPIGIDDMEIVWEWHSRDHLIQDVDDANPNFGIVADNFGRIDINYVGPSSWEGTDWWHANAIDYHPELDQILLNVRNNNEMWIIDHSTTSDEAAGDIGGQSGKGGELIFRWGNADAYNRGAVKDVQLYGNHGTYWIPQGVPNAGNILYFNNGRFRPEGIYSTIDMIHPQRDDEGNYILGIDDTFMPAESAVLYQATNPFDFLSNYLSNAQQLPNGNILINEGGDGHLFEVDANGDIVWDYINPDSEGRPVVQFDSPYQNSIFRAYKYSSDFSGFEGRDMEATEPLEGESIYTINCHSFIIDNTNELFTLPGRVYYDEQQAKLALDGLPILDIHLYVSDVLGRIVLQKEFVASNTHRVTLADINSGIYIIHIQAEDGARLSTKIWIP